MKGEGRSEEGEITPWLETVDALDRWRRETGVQAPAASTVAELHELLAQLTRRETAVPPEMALPAEGLQALAQRPDVRAKFAQWRARRLALLRLGVWRALSAAHDAGASHAMSALQAAMAQGDPRVPPGLSPTVGFAGGERAPEFFGRLRLALEQLARRHPTHAPLLDRLGDGGDVATVAGAQAWSEAWSAAIAANYLDCLDQKACGSTGAAMSLVWRSEATQIYGLSGLALLPAAEKELQMDLWTGLVAAQALDHRPERFAARDPWHRVTLKMRGLGVREQGRRRQRIDRGLGVDLLHLPVFADRAWLALRTPRRAKASVDNGALHAAHPPTVVLELPLLAPGQQANFSLVLRLADSDAAADGDDAPRLANVFPPPALDATQRGIYDEWLTRRGRGAARPTPRALAATLLDWQAPEAEGDIGPRPVTSLPFDLGSGALWRAASSPARAPQWLDVALVVRQHGCWAVREVSLYGCVAGGELHAGLQLEEPAPALEVAALRRALAMPGGAIWVASEAGLGTLLMAGIDLDRRTPRHAA